jgi:hypothetical protein
MENQDVAPIPTTSAYGNAPVSPAPKRGLYPKTIGSLIMGIIAVCLCWFSIIPIVGLIFFIPSFILGLVAFLRAKKGYKEVTGNPEAYAKASEGLLKGAKITGLISVIAAPAMLVIGFIWLALEESHIF